MSFSIDYADDFVKARDILLNVCSSHERILKDPAPLVRMNEHSASAIVICVKAWVKNADYWDVYFDLNERVKAAFDENEIHIPFNQLDVHVKRED
jgi:small conductance mechanosensitive channel